MRVETKRTVVDFFWTLLLAALAGVLLMTLPEQSRSEEAGSAASQAGQPRLLEFYSDWCSPCQSMTPIVNALKSAGHMVQRINIDDQPSLARQYDITRVPCFVVIVDGQEVDRVVGEAPYERLEVMTKRGQAKIEVRTKVRTKEPTSPWRYERPIGHRASVVRIFCQEGGNTRSIGSGTLVRWRGRLVVLTARHVIRGAKNIIVELCTRRTHSARVLKADAVWDCAVLELVDRPEGVEPAEVELGDTAMQREGNRLESCGYGPDGKLACNNGLFLGYRRSAETPTGPDDWMMISGHARGGDSGGPVFNERGRLVGVLWGTDGTEVACVQAGRIHQLLDAAVPKEASVAMEQQATIVRRPTPPKEPESPRGPLAIPLPTQDARPSDVDATSAYGAKQPLLKWRDGAQQKDASLDARIEALIALQERQARAAAPTPAVREAPVKEADKVDVRKDEPSPFVAVLCIAGSIGLSAAMYYLTAKES